MKYTLVYIIFFPFMFFQCISVNQFESKIIDTDNSPIARHECAFVEVDGLFYLLGGRGIKPIDIYNFDKNQWTQGASPPIEIHHFQALDYKGNIYIFGAMTGKYPHEKPLDRVLIYKPKKNKWFWGDSIPISRRRGSVGVVLKGNNAYLLCGITDGHWSGHVSWLDKYDFETGKWTILKDAPRPRDHFQAAIYKDQIYCVGGRNSSAKTKETFSLTIPEVDVYNTINNTWSTLPDSLNLTTQRAGASTLIYRGDLIVIGGESASQKTAHNNIEVLKLGNGKWKPMSSLVQGRHGTQAVCYKNAIYTVAGSGSRGGRPELSSMEKISK